MTCAHCRWAKASRKGLCLTCYMYVRRNGKPRPWKLIVRQGERVLARQVR